MHPFGATTSLRNMRSSSGGMVAGEYAKFRVVVSLQVSEVLDSKRYPTPTPPPKNISTTANRAVAEQSVLLAMDLKVVAAGGAGGGGVCVRVGGPRPVVVYLLWPSILYCVLEKKKIFIECLVVSFGALARWAGHADTRLCIPSSN